MRLKNLRLKRVSLVNDPANEEALVVLFKSNDKPAQEAPVTKDDDVAMAAQRKRESERTPAVLFREESLVTKLLRDLLTAVSPCHDGPSYCWCQAEDGRR
jgi:hypothetical protein